MGIPQIQKGIPRQVDCPSKMYLKMYRLKVSVHNHTSGNTVRTSSIEDRYEEPDEGASVYIAIASGIATGTKSNSEK